MKKTATVTSAVALLATLAACSNTPEAPPTVDEARRFIERMDEELHADWMQTDRAGWVNATYITPDTDWLTARAAESSMATKRRLIEEARRFAGLDLPFAARRQLELLRLSSSAPSPSDPAERRELAETMTFLESTYGKGKVCLPGKECLDLGQLTKILATSRDYDELLAVWRGWRQISVPMRAKYQRFAELTNKGAREIGFADNGDIWRSRYDMPPAQFEVEAERLWQQVAPLYDALHCYVRRRLAEHYGADKVSPTGPIPAHLLGNMWAQEWGNIYPLVEPYPGEASLDVNAALQARGWDAQRMVKTGEAFFTSLGMRPLPESFWQRSMITQPAGRDVVCHASAWDMGGTDDVRIKMCTEITEEDLNTIHHELGHIYYYLHYTELPALFKRGAHDGFHEGIGDTLVLSITPRYLKELGLLDQIADNPKAEINLLMKRALDKVAFLPFGKLIDQWRWEVFDGRIGPEAYNAGWWRLRQAYQGIAPPVPRSEADFDPGAKYHIPANTPYMRYFLAHIMQFQFHRALCQAAGHEGPLHRCSIYGSEKAGAKLSAMLALGQSRPWPEALVQIAGTEKMDAAAVLDYFAPLAAYLDEANRGRACGW